MAIGNQTLIVLGFSALFYLVLLSYPLTFVQTALAKQDPLQERSGIGEIIFSLLRLTFPG
jgi:hypothetical protein